MRKKNTLISFIAAGALSLTAIALCSVQPVSGFAETVESEFIIQEGASVRFATAAETQEGKAVNGIRFAAYITETYYQTLTQTTYPTASAITLQSTVSKVVEEGEAAPTPFTYSWNLKKSITFDDQGVATFYHTLNFNSLTGENLKAANAFDMEADFWIEVTAAGETEAIKIEADNAAEVNAVRSMRQVAYTAYTTEGTKENPNDAYQDNRLKKYFTLGASTEAVYDMDVASKAILETAPESVEADKVYVVDEDSLGITDVTGKVLAGDTGVFTALEGRADTIKELVYFDENNVAHPTKTRFVTKIVDNEAELVAALFLKTTTTATKNDWGYHLLNADVTVSEPLTTSKARTIYSGTFDGNGHKITVSYADTFRGGLFGTSLNDINVKNLEIDVTRDFGTVDNAEYQAILGSKANVSYPGLFMNVSVNVRRANGDDTQIRQYNDKYYLYLLTNSYAEVDNVVVHVEDGVLKRADESDGLPFIVQGFKKHGDWYVFSSDVSANGTNYHLYEDVADAVEKGEDFSSLLKSGYFTVDETNKTLSFGKTDEIYVPEDTITQAKLDALISKLQAEGIRNISFLGDSITTYEGWSNNTAYNSTIGSNAVHYNDTKTASIKSVNDVWWKQLLDMTNTNLCVNNAYSGDRVTQKGVSRSLQLHRDGESVVNPDMIFVYFGVNDFNNRVALETFKTTYDTMIKGMKEKYSGAKIYVGTIMLNGVRSDANDLREQFNQAIKDVAAKYEIGVVDFYNDSGLTIYNMSKYYWEAAEGAKLHPNALGMDVMTETILKQLIKDYIG